MAASKKDLRICLKGHKYYKSTDCPTCPICEEERKPNDGFLSLLGAPARRALENAGIKTLIQLSKYSEKEILKLHGFGKSSLPKLHIALKEKGLSFTKNKMDRQKQILENEKKLLNAIKNNGVTILEELLHDELLFVIPTGQVITKTMDLDNYRSGKISISDISSDEPIVKFIDDVAISTMIVAIKGSYFSQPIDGKFRYIRIWKLCNTQWKVIGGSGTQV